jgi:two-component system, LytTR family, response regulator
MNILIIEDEPWAAKDLQNLILKLEPEVKILGVMSSAEGSRKWLSEHSPPDLIFSDIQLSDGLSFEIFETLQIPCPIIFTTAYDDYAIRAFKLNSIDYLLKPIDEKELRAALTKYRALNTGATIEGELRSMMGNWGQPTKKYKERFLTIHRNALVPVGLNEVAFFHKEELIYLHTINGDKFICEHPTMDEIESLLNPTLFFRVNRQYIIHVQSVDRVKTTHKGLTVQLKSPLHTEIDISREKATAFKSWLG